MTLFLALMAYLVAGFVVTLVVESQGGQWKTWQNRLVGTIIWPLVLIALVWMGRGENS